MLASVEDPARKCFQAAKSPFHNGLDFLHFVVMSTEPIGTPLTDRPLQIVLTPVARAGCVSKPLVTTGRGFAGSAGRTDPRSRALIAGAAGKQRGLQLCRAPLLSSGL